MDKHLRVMYQGTALSRAATNPAKDLGFSPCFPIDLSGALF